MIAILVFFRKEPWVQKSWKILATVIPPIVILALTVFKNKSVQTPKPTPTPVPVIPVVPVTLQSDSTNVTSIVIGISYQLSSHFTYGLMTKTEHREMLEKNRDQGKRYIDHLSLLCNNVLEPVWTLIGPISINSCFRCPDLNSAIGGAKNSQHLVAEAADTEYAGITLQEAFNKIAFSNSIPYSQIIIEWGWIHIGLIDNVLYPGKIGQKLIATQQINNTGQKKVIYSFITEPL